jgi:predicted ABC-type ATPase
VGGPNGSGKSSIIRWLEFEGRNNLLEVDAIAKRIDPASPRRAAVAAAKEVIRRTREYLKNHQSFAIETTLPQPSVKPRHMDFLSASCTYAWTILNAASNVCASA